MIEQQEQLPIIGDWYKNSLNQAFEIVAIDEADETIEVQFYDGEVAEFDRESWQMLEIVPIAPPEDWSAPFDDLEKEDLGHSDAVLRPEDWSGPFDGLDKLGL